MAGHDDDYHPNLRNDPYRYEILSLEVGEQKAIKDLRLSFEQDVTVIAGKNGVGKTTILETISNPERARSRMGYAIQDVKEPNISLVGSRYLHANDEMFLEADVNRLLFYPQERAQRFGEGSVGDTEISAVVESFEAWWVQRDIDEARRVRRQKDLSYRDWQLINFETAIKKTDAFKDARFDAEPQLTITRGETSVRWHDLSSGERAIFTLVGDLARRSAPLMRPGVPLINFVVLIDEIELHLHPTWQRQILPILTQAFPFYQFIVTTHSPQVIGSVDARCVRILSRDADGRTKVSVPNATKGIDSNSILEALMGAGERDIRAADMINNFLDLLSGKRWKEAEALLEEVSEYVEDPSSIVPGLKVQLEFARRRSKQ